MTQSADKFVNRRGSITVFSIAILSLCPLWIGCFNIQIGTGKNAPMQEILLQGTDGPKVLLVDIEGEITDSDSPGVFGWMTRESTVAQIRDQLDFARREGDVAAVLLRIDSPGGSPTASQSVFNQVMGFKRSQKLPVTAQMMGTATSGAYMAAMSADEVVAYPTSITGSIGVILLGINLSGLMEKVGVANQTFTSGPYKDAGSMLRPMTPAEHAQIQSVVDDLYSQFVEVVEQGRPKLDAKRVKELADGRIYSARQALQFGLIDRISALDETVEQIRRQLGAAQVRVISYHRGHGGPTNIYARDTLPRSPKISSDAMERLGPRPGFYYLWWPGTTPP